MKQIAKKEKQEQIDVLVQFFHMEPGHMLSVSDLSSIDRYDLIRFGNEVIDCCVEHNETLLKSISVFLQDINKLIDSYMDDTMEKAYNLIAFRYIYDILYLHADTVKQNKAMYERLLNALNNENYSKIVEALCRRQTLFQAELARETKLSPQNLSRYLGKLNGTVVTATKLPFDRKRTYYRLNADFYQFFQNHPSVLPEFKTRKDLPDFTLEYGDRKMFAGTMEPGAGNPWKDVHMGAIYIKYADPRGGARKQEYGIENYNEQARRSNND